MLPSKICPIRLTLISKKVTQIKKKETSCRLLEPRNLINAPIPLKKEKRDSTAQASLMTRSIIKEKSILNQLMNAVNPL